MMVVFFSDDMNTAGTTSRRFLLESMRMRAGWDMCGRRGRPETNQRTDSPPTSPEVRKAVQKGLAK